MNVLEGEKKKTLKNIQDVNLGLANIHVHVHVQAGLTKCKGEKKSSWDSIELGSSECTFKLAYPNDNN